MPLYACRTCGRTSELRYCPAHRQPDRGHTGRSPSRDRSAQRALRRRLIQQHGERCQRCGREGEVRAAHRVAVRHGGGYRDQDAELLCPACDRASDPYAR